MSELREAMEVLLRVNFKANPPSATDAARLGEFLERAAQEVLSREEAVAERERAVSQREANAELQASELANQLKAIGAVSRVARVLDLKPLKGKSRWSLR
jgi:hypothetical protein